MNEESLAKEMRVPNHNPASSDAPRAAHRRYPRSIWLPAALSALLLLSIAAAFFVLGHQVGAHRRMLGEVLEPANKLLARFHLSLLNESASQRSYLSVPGRLTLGQLRAMHERTVRTLDSLSLNAGRIGPEFSRDLARLRDMFAQWSVAPVAFIEGRVQAQDYKPWMPQQASLAESVLSRAAQLDGTASLQMQREIALLRRLERDRLYILATLFPLALGGIVLTAWLGRRAMSAQEQLVDDAAQEALLLDAIADLTGDRVLPDALNRIAAHAMRMGSCDGVFIERSDQSRTEVEIVAAVGTGAPPGAHRVRFVGSVTDDIVRAGTTEFTAEVSGRDSELVRLLGDDWQQCFVLAVPLRTEADVDGALVLLRPDHPIQVRGETLSRLKALGAWAAVALRRQRLANELAAKQARLVGVIDQMPLGVVLADAPSGRVSIFNRHAVDLWGSPTTPPVAIDEYAHWKLFHPDGREYAAHERPLARSLLTGATVQGEEGEIEREDGTRTPVRINAAPIRDATGGVIAGVATVDDITEEKRRELATRFLDEISRQLASTLDYEATVAAVLQLLVPRLADAASIHHRTDEAMIRRWATATDNQRISQLMSNLDRDYPMPLPSAHPVAVAIRTGKPQLRETVGDDLQQTIARDERQLGWLRSLGLQSAIAVPLIVRGKTIGALQLLSVNPAHHYTCNDLELTQEIARRASLAIDNAQLFRTVSETGDVSRFLADASLALSGSLEHEEVLHRVTSLAVPSFADFALAYLKDPRGVVQQAASAHHDAAKQPLLAELAQLCRPDPHNLGSTVVKALTTGQPVLIERVTPEILDSQRFIPRVRELFDQLGPVSWMTVPLVARGTALGAIVFASARSERRYAAKDVTLGQRLADAAALAMQNAILYRSVQDAVVSRDEVLAIVSHDLRNPLHTIGMSSQLLLDEVAVDEAQRKRHLEIIGRAKGRMDRLIQDLLDVTRVEAGKALAIEQKPQRVSPLVRDTCESFAIQAREKRIHLEWVVPDATPDVLVDFGRIHQVLCNLIGNALKVTPEGGRIDVRVSEEKGMVLVSVQDTGPGIPADDLERVFRRFWQAPRAARQGAGLGLAISRGIIEQHGGRLWATSQEGKGATFFFTLPRPATPESRAA